MLRTSLLLAACGIASTLASPVATHIEERASSCTFSGSTGAAAAIKGKKSCSTIVLNNVAVPAGTTLDLTGLNDGTKVRGSITFCQNMLIQTRSSFKAQQRSATKSGKAHLSPSLGRRLRSLELQAPFSMATVRVGGTAMVPTAARRSPSSSTLMA